MLKKPIGKLLPLLCLFLCLFVLFWLPCAAEEGISLSADADTLTYGESITLTATGVAGEVSFYADGEELGKAEVLEGTATLCVPLRTQDIGEVSLTAVAGGQTSAPLYVEVTKRPITVLNFVVEDREYDGTQETQCHWDALDGLLDGDAVELSVFACLFNDKNIGRDKPVMAFLQLIGKDAALYELTQTMLNCTASITPREVRIEGLVATDRVYNGGREVVLSGGRLENVVENDRVSVTLPTWGTAESANVGEWGVIFDEIRLSGSGAGNYMLVQPQVSVRISPATLFVAVEPVQVNRGQYMPATLPLTMSGFVAGESDSTIEGFRFPVASPAGEVDTLDITLTSFAVAYEEGFAGGNYVFSYAETAVLHIVSVVATAADYQLSADVSVWQNTPFSITPRGSYTKIAKAGNGALAWSDTLVVSAEGSREISFYLRREDGTTTEVTAISYLLDTTPPQVNVTVNDVSILTKIDPVLHFFYRGSLPLSVLTTDEVESGVAVSGEVVLTYQKVALGESPRPDGYTAEFAPNAPELFVLYVRAVDAAGNVTEVHTDGIVLYLDSILGLNEASYTCRSTEGLYLPATFYQNRVLRVLVGDGEVPLSDVEMTENALVLSPAFLNTLDAGNYDCRVQFLPLGYEFLEGDTPTEGTFTLIVNKRTPVVADLAVSGLTGQVYNGEPHGVIVTVADGVLGLGEWSVTYYLDETPLASAPTQAGSYFVRVTLLEGRYYSATELTVGTLVLAKAPREVPPSVGVIACTTLQNGDGVLTGLTLGMCYRKTGEEVWQEVTGETAANLTPGVYEIYWMTDENHLDSAIVERTVARYDGYREDTPAITFDAEFGVLTGVLPRQMYRINGGEWCAIPTDFSAVVTDVCVLEFYLVGDGVYTLDSEVQRIDITRCGQPQLSLLHESVFAYRDGVIFVAEGKLEYRPLGAAEYIAAEDRIEGLAPGVYEVRLRSTGTALFGDAVQVEILGAPEFFAQQLQGNALTLSGNMTYQAALSERQLTTEEIGTYFPAVDLRTTRVLCATDLSVVGGSNGTVTAQIAVPAEYNGQTLTVYYRLSDGTVRSAEALCEDGLVQMTMDDPAPFAVTVAMTTPHGVGSAAWIYVLAALVGIFALFCVVMEIKTRKGRGDAGDARGGS